MNRTWSLPKKLAAALLFGVLIEVVLIGASLVLFKLSYRRAPMDDPFSWTGIMIHQPGVAISQALGTFTNGWDTAVIGIVQTLIWALIGLFAVFWHTKRNHRGKETVAR